MPTTATPESTEQIAIRLLVSKVLETADRHEWTIQGLGMLRTYLSKELRLHVWDDRFALSNVSRLHDHPWSFESLVVCGHITNRVYSTVDYKLSKTHHEQQIRCGSEGHLVEGTKRDVNLELYREWPIRAGHSYLQDRDFIHDTIAERGTVTLVRRRFYEDTEHARVYFPIGTDWVPGTPRPATPAEVATIVEAALQRLRETLP